MVNQSRNPSILVDHEFELYDRIKTLSRQLNERRKEFFESFIDEMC